MKKIGTLLLLGALLAVSCGKNSETKDNGKADSAVSQQSQENGKVDLSKETAEYKKFVEDQIDTLLKDTENFAQLLKEGKLEEAKKVYPLIRMAYERSEPIAESFGESDVNIDFRLVDFKEEKALVSDGILDSIDIISLVQELDEEFDITIKPADLIPENFNSVEAISKLVEKLMED